MEACWKEVNKMMFFSGDSLMAAFLVAELVGDPNLKKKCLDIVKRFVFYLKSKLILSVIIFKIYSVSNRNMLIPAMTSRNWLTIVERYPELANKIAGNMIADK
jgi:hypothetical protein